MEASGPDPGRSRSGRGRRSPWAVLRMAGPGSIALVALASSAIALAFTLFPRLAPDPGTTYRAKVAVFAIEPGVTFGAYLHRIAFSRSRYRERRDELLQGEPRSSVAAALRLPGDLAYVASTVEGFKHGSVSLRWSLYEARSGRRVHGESFADVPAARLDLDAPTDRTMQLVWIPSPPPGRGPYFVRVGLYDQNDTPLDIADSRCFYGP